jgi:hypothetical protein
MVCGDPRGIFPGRIPRGSGPSLVEFPRGSVEESVEAGFAESDLLILFPRDLGSTVLRVRVVVFCCVIFCRLFVCPLYYAIFVYG